VFIRASLFLAAILFFNASSAATLSYNYTGTTDGGTATIAGSFGYDTSIQASTLMPEVFQFQSAGFFTGTIIGGQQDGTSFRFDNIDLLMLDDFAFLLDDAVQLGYEDSFGFHEDYTDGQNVFPITLYFRANNTSVITDHTIPTALALSDFDLARISIYEDNNQPVRFDIDSLSAPSPVPLPPTLWLFCSSLIAMAAYQRLKVNYLVAGLILPRWFQN
jgi:uncharacterized protein YkuJ